MRYVVVALALAAGACAGTEVTPSDTSTPGADLSTSTLASTTTSSSTATSTEAEPTTTSTAVHTPSTEGWGTWTVILASIETGEPGSREEAEELAAGLDGASVLWSDDFPSLNSGYWVVYRGEFESGSEASNSCSDLPVDMTCYPRYLGSAVSPLATDGNAMLIDGQALVIVDVATGERLKIFDPYFEDDGMFVGRMSLTPDASALYYDVGWEDSWYSCESSQGQIWKMDLAFGIDTNIAPGFNPTVSPDGRWMAALLSEQCLPDPAQPESWVLTPTDTIVLYDLTSGWPTEKKRWSTEFAPTAYDDPQMLAWVGWRADSESLVAMNNAGTVFELSLNHAGPVDAGSPLVAVVYGYPQALIGETLYMIRDETPEAFGGFDLVAVDLTTGATGEVITQTVGWPYAAADTARTRLIWGSDTQVGTAETMFSLEAYLTGLAW